MIAWIQGTVVNVESDRLVLSVGGLGYELMASQNTLASADVSTELTLFVYTHVREDLFQLFGFATRAEKMLFEAMIKVNGIGPKMAITILSGARLADITDMIENENVGGLTKLPKVGKKTAEQMILTLRGKLGSNVATADMSRGEKVLREQVFSALINLGFKASEVEKISDKIEEVDNVQDGVRRGLQVLGGQSL